MASSFIETDYQYVPITKNKGLDFRLNDAAVNWNEANVDVTYSIVEFTETEIVFKAWTLNN